MKSTPLRFTPANAALRRTAGDRLRGSPPADEELSPPDLRSALGELRIYESELEIQNEELLDSRARIEESQRKYFRHFDLAPVGLIRLNLKGQILEANILGAQMLGEERVLLNTVPRTFLAHVSPESHVVFQQHLESALASRKMETCELSLRNTAGQETFVRIQSVVSRSEKDEKDFYVTLTDLTERREIEQKLELQKALAEAAVTSKELFFGMLSHKLPNPLTPLVALLEHPAPQPRCPAIARPALAIMRRQRHSQTHVIS